MTELVPVDQIVDLGSVFEALKEAEGNLSEAARELGISRNRLQTMVDRTPALVALMNDLREEIVDFAESNHHKRVKSGADPTAERFILQTLGKHRGYTTGVAGMGNNGDIVITVRKFSEEPNGPEN